MNEEDIEILERFSTIQRTGDMQFININYKELKQAIENLINRVKELEEKYNKIVTCHLRYEELTGIDLLMPDKSNVISKDKIKEKIENYNSKGYIEASGALQELLEE